MEKSIRCPNCGSPHIFLIITETVERMYRISSDGYWLSEPIIKEVGTGICNAPGKVLKTKLRLLCKICGQENEGIVNQTEPIRSCIEIGRELFHGQPFETDARTGDVTFL